jgi:hypothetical protein
LASAWKVGDVVNAADFIRIRGTISDEAAPLERRVAAVEEAVNSERLPLPQRLDLMRACLDAREEAVRHLGVTALGARVQSPRITANLRELLDDPSEFMRGAALLQLATRQDSAVYARCAHWLCHGTPGLRQAARTAAVLLQGEETRGLLVILWQSSDLSDDERTVIAAGLYRRGDHVGEACLERRLAHPDVLWRAFIACELARTGKPIVLDVIERLAMDATLEAEHRKSVRFLFWAGLRLPIPHDAPDAEWTAAVLAWVARRRGGSLTSPA